jgi:hypothetical protein
MGDQLPIPAQNRVWLGRGSYFLQCLATQPMTDFSQGGPLGIRKAQPTLDLCFQDAGFSGFKIRFVL